jgi:hypothetical protein
LGFSTIGQLTGKLNRGSSIPAQSDLRLEFHVLDFSVPPSNDISPLTSSSTSSQLLEQIFSKSPQSTKKKWLRICETISCMAETTPTTTHLALDGDMKNRVPMHGMLLQALAKQMGRTAVKSSQIF